MEDVNGCRILVFGVDAELTTRLLKRDDNPDRCLNAADKPLEGYVTGSKPSRYRQVELEQSGLC
jgi:hypothetical protein